MKTQNQLRQLERDADRKMKLAMSRADCPPERLEQRWGSDVYWHVVDHRPGIAPIQVASRFHWEPIQQSVGQIAKAIRNAMAAQDAQKCVTPDAGSVFVVEFHGYMDEGLGWQVTGHCRPEGCDPKDHARKAGWHLRGMHGGTSPLRPPVLKNSAAFVLDRIGGEYYPSAARGAGAEAIRG